MNEGVGKKNRHQKTSGKILLVQKNDRMSYVNLLGALYCKLPMGRKDANFGRVLPEETVRRQHV